MGGGEKFDTKKVGVKSERKKKFWVQNFERKLSIFGKVSKFDF